MIGIESLCVVYLLNKDRICGYCWSSGVAQNTKVISVLRRLAKLSKYGYIIMFSLYPIVRGSGPLSFVFVVV